MQNTHSNSGEYRNILNQSFLPQSGYKKRIDNQDLPAKACLNIVFGHMQEVLGSMAQFSGCIGEWTTDNFCDDGGKRDNKFAAGEGATPVAKTLLRL